MSRNYKRDRKGRFAKVGAARASRKAAKATRLDSPKRIYKREFRSGAGLHPDDMKSPGKLIRSETHVFTGRQVRSVHRHTAAGAAIGTVVLPGVGTVVGAVAGQKVGNRRKKNQAKVSVRNYK